MISLRFRRVLAEHFRHVSTNYALLRRGNGTSYSFRMRLNTASILSSATLSILFAATITGIYC